MRQFVFCFVFLLISCDVWAKDTILYNSPKAGNPIIPGYFADPTIRKFGDLYYLYATTDGNGGGFGPSQVWVSKDFVNWCILPMNWPVTPYIWAPDVIKSNNGKYYMFYSQPCQVYCGEAESPIGPWHNVLEGDAEKPLVPDQYVKGAITLDGQTFVDDDGSTYLYWGTWGIYPEHGCGIGKLTSDMKQVIGNKLIPNTQLKDFFEAPFMFKKDGKYYMTYSSGSCHDDTYRVQYATSVEGPYGPFVYADNNPILSSSADKTIHGPGHHSILVENGNYYIVYHRHNIPNSTRGMHRQIAADRMEFDLNGNIKKIKASHKGVGYLQKNANPYKNLAFGAKVRASSTYNSDFVPQYAIDDNNATLWRPKSCGKEWIEIDLGEIKEFTRIWTEFEYATSYYQYVIEVSNDRKHWTVFSDRRENTTAGSPMSDKGKAKARYIRLTITGNQKNGLFGAIWNIKVFNGGEDWFASILANRKWEFNKDSSIAKRKGLVFELNASSYSPNMPISQLIARNNSNLKFDAMKDSIWVRMIDGSPAFIFTGNQLFKSTTSLGKAFVGNAPYSLMAWIYVDKLSDNEYFFDLTDKGDELGKVAVGYGIDKHAGIVSHHGGHEDLGMNFEPKTSQWVLLSIVFDGYMEKVYVNGRKVNERNLFLRLQHSDNITIGAKWDGSFAFKNYLNSITLYDVPISEKVIWDYYKRGREKTLFVNQFHSMNDIKSLNLRPVLNAVSPNCVRISFGAVVDNNYALKFNYKNLTTGYETGWVNSLSFYDANLEEGGTYKYLVKVKDSFGNMAEYEPLIVHTSKTDFDIFEDSFNQDIEYSINRWTGISGGKLDENTVVVSDGKLLLESAGMNFYFSGNENGPLLYKEVKGDFLAEVEIIDFSGKDIRKPVAFNEGGLMFSYEGEGGQNLVHLGVFPFYGVGNILTDLSKEHRLQYNNKSDWNYSRYLQLERCGDFIYARISTDKKNWVEMPGSPVKCNIVNGKKIRLGLYQATYTQERASFSFDNFRLWQQRK